MEQMDNILYWIVVGVAAGWLAKMVVPGSAPGGIIGDFVVGIVGAVAGGYIFDKLLGHSSYGLLGSIGVAFVGAVVLLSILRAIGGRFSSNR